MVQNASARRGIPDRRPEDFPGSFPLREIFFAKFFEFVQVIGVLSGFRILLPPPEIETLPPHRTPAPQFHSRTSRA
jgi:hypothetical protein